MTSALEPVRELIDASENYLKIGFEKFVNVLIKSFLTEKRERKSAILTLHDDKSAVIKLIEETHGQVQGFKCEKHLYPSPTKTQRIPLLIRKYRSWNHLRKIKSRK